MLPIKKKQKRIKQPRALTDEEMKEIGLRREYDEQGCVWIKEIDASPDQELAKKILDLMKGEQEAIMDDIEELCKKTLERVIGHTLSSVTAVGLHFETLP